MSFYLDGTKQQGGHRNTRPVIGMHTSENAPGTRNLALAVFIRGRSDYGSYDMICDTYDELFQLSGLSTKTWHAPAINGYASSLSFVTRAADWKKLSDRARKALLRSGAEGAHITSQWHKRNGRGTVPAKVITRWQADNGHKGFITHEEVQPADRTDPGKDFPWDEFFTYYRAYERGASGVKPVAAEKSAHKGWCVADKHSALHTLPSSKSRKVRTVRKGEPLLIASDAEVTKWWIQVGDYWIPRSAVAKGNGDASRKLFHGNFPDRAMPLNGTRTTELDLAWEELLYRLGAHKGSPYSDLHEWLGTKGVAGAYVQRIQRFLKLRGYYDGAIDNKRDSKTVRAEKEFLNDQRRYFTPKPASAMPKLRGYTGKVY